MSENLNLIELTADVVSSHVSNNAVAVGDMPNLIRQVHQALTALAEPTQAQEPKEQRNPAVSVRSSVKPDFLICLECGQKQKTLKRHLKTAHGMTPQEYREAFGLKSDYPMVAPSYSERRSEMARSIGLGRKAESVGADDPPLNDGDPADPEATQREEDAPA